MSGEIEPTSCWEEIQNYIARGIEELGLFKTNLPPTHIFLVRAYILKDHCVGLV